MYLYLDIYMHAPYLPKMLNNNNTSCFLAMSIENNGRVQMAVLKTLLNRTGIFEGQKMLVIYLCFKNMSNRSLTLFGLHFIKNEQRDSVSYITMSTQTLLYILLCRNCRTPRFHIYKSNRKASYISHREQISCHNLKMSYCNSYANAYDSSWNKLFYLVRRE